MFNKTPNFDTLIELYDAFSGIKFFEKNHRYEVDGEKALMSVSGLISKYEKPFDSKKIAARIANRDNLPIQYILEEWNFNKEYSCHKGSQLHLYIENFLERRHSSLNRDSIINFLSNFSSRKTEEDYYKDVIYHIRNFINFYEWWKQDHILIKSEFVIGDKKTKICGTIDNLSYNKKTKSFSIFDYKTNKKIERQNSFGEKMLYELSHLDKCEYIKYSLQLNLYKEIFERNCDFKIEDSYIVWIGGNKDYELIKTLNLKEEATTMLKNI